VSLSQTITDGVDTAFESMGDVAKDATLALAGGATFDFATGDATEVDKSSVKCQVAVVRSKRELKDRKTRLARLIFKAKDVGDPTRYTTAVIENRTWKIDSVIKADDYIVIIEASTEA